jgi:hypothetical protein
VRPLPNACFELLLVPPLPRDILKDQANAARAGLEDQWQRPSAVVLGRTAALDFEVEDVLRTREGLQKSLSVDTRQERGERREIEPEIFNVAYFKAEVIEESVVCMENEESVIKNEYQIGREAHQVCKRQPVGEIEDFCGAKRAHLGLTGDSQGVEVLRRRSSVERKPARDLLNGQPFRILPQ